MGARGYFSDGLFNHRLGIFMCVLRGFFWFVVRTARAFRCLRMFVICIYFLGLIKFGYLQEIWGGRSHIL